MIMRPGYAPPPYRGLGGGEVDPNWLHATGGRPMQDMTFGAITKPFAFRNESAYTDYLRGIGASESVPSLGPNMMGPDGSQQWAEHLKALFPNGVPSLGPAVGGPEGQQWRGGQPQHNFYDAVLGGMPQGAGGMTAPAPQGNWFGGAYAVAFQPPAGLFSGDQSASRPNVMGGGGGGGMYGMGGRAGGYGMVGGYGLGGGMGGGARAGVMGGPRPTMQ